MTLPRICWNQAVFAFQRHWHSLTQCLSELFSFIHLPRCFLHQDSPPHFRVSLAAIERLAAAGGSSSERKKKKKAQGDGENPQEASKKPPRTSFLSSKGRPKTKDETSTVTQKEGNNKDRLNKLNAFWTAFTYYWET